jgi:anti-sigma-K factor RskA
MSEIHGATGSYVLNALDPSELDEFEAHLAVCPTCSQEVVEFCETAAQLSLLATAPPPPALKGSVMAAIGGVRVLPPESPQVEEPAPSRALEPVGAAPVDELAVRRQQRRARILSLAVAAVTVVALALGGWVYSLVQQQQSQVASSNLETQLYSAADVVIKPVTLPNGAKGSFVAAKSLNRAMFTSSELPSPGADRAYQLWTLTGTLKAPTKVVPDNTLSGGTAVKQFFRGDIAGSTLVAISNEPAGGSPLPTTQPTIVQL